MLGSFIARRFREAGWVVTRGGRRERRIRVSVPLYFQRANASFAGATIATTEVGEELRRWSIWHWVRVVLAIAAFAVAVVAARKA